MYGPHPVIEAGAQKIPKHLKYTYYSTQTKSKFTAKVYQIMGNTSVHIMYMYVCKYFFVCLYNDICVCRVYMYVCVHVICSLGNFKPIIRFWTALHTRKLLTFDFMLTPV